MAHTHHEIAGPGGPASEQLSEHRDALFDALAHGYRRFVLVYLDREENPVAPGKLATSLADAEAGTTADRALIALSHTHLPKLEAANFIEYDDAVRLCDAAEPALELLDHY